jgi:hypothetical protein
MRDTVSSRTTFFMKFIFPALWIGGFGAASLAALRTQLGAPPGAPHRLVATWVVVGIWLVCSVVLLWFCAPLKRIRMRDGKLLASNYRREIAISPADIERVTQNTWVNVRPITLHLRAPTALGSRIAFIPPSHVILAFRQSDRLVAGLRAFAGLAQHATAEPDTLRGSSS